MIGIYSKKASMSLGPWRLNGDSRIKNKMKSKTVFLVMIAEEFHQKVLPFSILYVGTALEKAGYDVILRHIKPEQMDLTIDEICDVQPLMTGFSVLTGLPTLRSSVMSKKIKERIDNIPVVWGGVHPSLLPEQCVSEEYIDFVVIGEGEASSVELADALSNKKDVSGIQGLAFKDRSGKVCVNERAKLHTNLEQYPIDFDLIDMEMYISEEVVLFKDKPTRVRSIGYCASRGCPHSCGFCYNLKFNQRRWRAPSSAFIINDILRLKEKYGITKVHFWDDNFFVDRDRAYTILKGIDMISGLELRVDYITDDIARQLRDLKVVFLIFGVESGSNRLLRLMNKGFDTGQVIKVSKILGDLHIDTLYSAIFGLPTETEDEFNATIDLLLKIKKNHKEASFTAGMYLPYPGTDMYELAVKEGFCPPSSTADWNVLDRWRNVAPLPWVDKKICLNVRHLLYFLTSKSYIVQWWAGVRLKHRLLNFDQDIKLHILVTRIISRARDVFKDIFTKRKDDFMPGLSLRGRMYRYLSVRLMLFVNRIWHFHRLPKGIDRNSIEKVLIIHPQMAGDNVVATPMIRNLAKQLRKAKIHLLTGRYSYAVLSGNPHISNYLFCDEKEEKTFLGWIRLLKRLRKEHFDLVIDTQFQFSTLKRSLVPFLSGARYRVGFWRAKGFRGIFNTHEALYNSDKHGAYLFLDLIKAMGLDIIDEQFEVYFTERDAEAVSRMLKDAGMVDETLIIGLHAGNIDKVKLWSEEKFAAVGDELVDLYGAYIVLTGSVQDRPYLELLSSKMKHRPLILAGETTLPQLSALISRLALLISIDTVSVHIAAATDTPTVGIYGKTYIYKWIPWNKQKQVLITGYHRCAGCWLGDYFDRIIPTHTKTNICSRDYVCIKDISVDEVLEAAQELLKKYSPEICAGKI